VDSTYIYSPKNNTWTQAANMPYDDAYMASSGANGQLQVAGGFATSNVYKDINYGITAWAEQYDPVHNVWSALPDAPTAHMYTGGASCGLSEIGGLTPTATDASPSSEVLPGFDQCGGDQISWLATGRHSVELAPGQSIRVPVTVDASQVDAPGDYSAELTFVNDSPYVNAPTPVQLDASRPASWGEVSGTVTAAASGNTLAGATVQICTVRDTKNGTCSHPLYTVTTDTHGAYALWLPGGTDALDVVAADNGYTAETQEVTVHRGGSSEIDFALAQS
jgi:hypothetical protein